MRVVWGDIHNHRYVRSRVLFQRNWFHFVTFLMMQKTGLLKAVIWVILTKLCKKGRTKTSVENHISYDVECHINQLNKKLILMIFFID
jgi:hypothetical protein